MKKLFFIIFCALIIAPNAKADSIITDNNAIYSQSNYSNADPSWGDFSYAFDNDLGTMWAVLNVNVSDWGQVQFTNQHYITSYYISNANPSFYLTSWEIDGSNDGTNWDVIDNQTTAGAGYFNIPSPACYKYFKIKNLTPYNLHIFINTLDILEDTNHVCGGSPEPEATSTNPFIIGSTTPATDSENQHYIVGLMTILVTFSIFDLFRRINAGLTK